VGRIRSSRTCLGLVALALLAPLQATVALKPAAAPAAVAPRPVKPWKALEARKATIGKIVVEVGNVFDLTKPNEDTWVGHTANRLHITTREKVIRRALLFAEGDRVRERRIYETERLLRALPFVKDPPGLHFAAVLA